MKAVKSQIVQSKEKNINNINTSSLLILKEQESYKNFFLETKDQKFYGAKKL